MGGNGYPVEIFSMCYGVSNYYHLNFWRLFIKRKRSSIHHRFSRANYFKITGYIKGMLGIVADYEWMTIVEERAVCQKKLIPGKKNGKSKSKSCQRR